MAIDVLKGCKKCTIQRIIDPGCYLVAKYEREECFKEKIKCLHQLLVNNIEKCGNKKRFYIGQVVAVKCGDAFYRARVMDIFKRYCKTMCKISFIDSGILTEIDEKNIYCIKNHELKNHTADAFEISIHGIQPVAFEINYNNPVSGEIFKLRECNKWSASAFKYVENLFSDNRYIFVKIIDNSKRIYGEIYFFENLNEEPVSLGQKLCHKGFAKFCDSEVQSSDDYHHSGCRGGIEEKIPDNITISDFEPFETSVSKLDISSSCSSDSETKIDSSSIISNTASQKENSKSVSLSSLYLKTEEWNASIDNTIFSPSNSSNPFTMDRMKENLVEEPSKANRLNLCRILHRNFSTKGEDTPERYQD